MSSAISRHLNRRQLKTVERLGNIMLPSHCDLPSFSETGCLHHIDTVLEPSHPEDTNSLKVVLSVLSFAPDSVLRWILLRLETSGNFSGWVSAQLRLLIFGLRGIIFSLYYSGLGSPYKNSTVFEALDYHVQCRPDNNKSK